MRNYTLYIRIAKFAFGSFIYFVDTYRLVLSWSVASYVEQYLNNHKIETHHETIFLLRSACEIEINCCVSQEYSLKRKLRFISKNELHLLRISAESVICSMQKNSINRCEIKNIFGPSVHSCTAFRNWFTSHHLKSICPYVVDQSESADVHALENKCGAMHFT